ncbi:MAG: hypothetical protein ABJL43_15560 [Maribacter dokdonensis]|uniref:hypothetical protein n=1 Tax=Maribacter dokdonensis TaxID=320912 RepID=UPI0032979778
MKILNLLLFVTFTIICSAIGNAQQNVQTVGELPSDVFETSGLIYYNGNLITHNDSGNEPILYELDTLSLTIQRRVTVNNVTNIDWEAISQDEDYIYIGDFGNNVGTRTDLAVYRISKDEYTSSNTVTAEIINFSYENQQNFENNGNSDWDAEAFVVLEDNILVFTKQWQSLGSEAYQFSKLPGNHIAISLGAIENIGLLTDATHDIEANRLVLIGYSSILSPFVGVVEDLKIDMPFEGFTQESLGLNFVQAEGITQTTSGNYFFSSEYYSRQTPTIESPSRLFSFQIPLVNSEEPEEPETPDEPENLNEPDNPDLLDDNYGDEEDEKLIIYRDHSSDHYYYSISTDKNVYGKVIYDVTGKEVWQNSENVEKKGIIIQHLESSIYYMAIFLEDSVVSTPFAVY